MKYIILRSPETVGAVQPTNLNIYELLEGYVPKSFKFILHDGQIPASVYQNDNQFKNFEDYFLFVFEVTNQEDFTTFCLQWSELVVRVCEEIPEYFK